MASADGIATTGMVSREPAFSRDALILGLAAWISLRGQVIAGRYAGQSFAPANHMGHEVHPRLGRQRGIAGSHLFDPVPAGSRMTDSERGGVANRRYCGFSSRISATLTSASRATTSRPVLM